MFFCAAFLLFFRKESMKVAIASIFSPSPFPEDLKTETMILPIHLNPRLYPTLGLAFSTFILSFFLLVNLHPI